MGLFEEWNKLRERRKRRREEGIEEEQEQGLNSARLECLECQLQRIRVSKGNMEEEMEVGRVGSRVEE